MAAGRIVGENVGLEPDLVLRGIDRALQRGEVLGAIAQQRELVPGLEAIHVLPLPGRVLTLEIECCRQRRVVRQPRQRIGVMNVGVHDVQTARINAV